ncbi:MAG: hypothetical protein AAF334_01095 [Pseudomonadota bacterium]
MARFAGISADRTTPGSVRYALASVVERLWSEDAFCPAALARDPARNDDAVVLRFADQALSAVDVSFGYDFGRIGLNADTLSEQAMSACARAEWQSLLLDLAMRYGAPATHSEQPGRRGLYHVVCSALWSCDDGGAVQAVFGHAGGALVGSLHYRPRIGAGHGF